MESSSSQRPKLQKTRSTSSSFRLKKQGRATSKYGSIIEEDTIKDTSSSSNEEEEETEQQPNEGEEEQQQHLFTRQPSNHPSERLSMNSFDHEITLKDKQDVRATISTRHFAKHFFFLL